MLENRFPLATQRVRQLVRATLPEIGRLSQQARLQQHPYAMPILAPASPSQPKYPHV